MHDKDTLDLSYTVNHMYYKSGYTPIQISRIVNIPLSTVNLYIRKKFKLYDRTLCKTQAYHSDEMHYASDYAANELNKIKYEEVKNN